MTIDKYKEIMAYLKEVIDGSVFAGHVFAVGGCERDKRLRQPIKDIDLVVDIPNGGIMLANWLYENNLTVWAPVVYEHFGTAMFTLKKFPDIELETVQTRKESYRDIESRNPDTAYGTIMEDCTRRDFTVNAFYYDISNDRELDLNGMSEHDLKERIIRTCGDPEIIFNEDPLRILRMVRFATRLDFKIDEKTFECAKKYVDRLSIISRERIYEEFKKMITTGDYFKTQNAICAIWDIDAFKYILPHLHTMKMLDRMHLLNRIGRTCQHYPPKFEEIMAAIMCGYDGAESELHGLKLSNDEIDEIMFYLKENKILSSVLDYEGGDYSHIVRRVMNDCGTDRRFLTATIIGSPKLYHEFHAVCEDGFDGYSSLYDSVVEHEKKYFTYKLPVGGNDVMEVLGIGPSKEVKEALDRLWMFAFINPEYTDRENLMNYLKQVIKNDK